MANRSHFASAIADSLTGGGNSPAGARPIDGKRVRTRTVVFTQDQLILKNVIDARLPQVCADTETGIALLSYCLSELIMRTARPGLLPEAVATAVQVLQFNCGVAAPVPAVTLPADVRQSLGVCPHGYALPERGLPTDCQQCAEHGRINRGEIPVPLTDHEAQCAINKPNGNAPRCDCAFGRQFK